MKKLLPPFLLLTVIATIYQLFALKMSFTEILANLKDGTPPLATSWYIYALIIFYVIFNVSARIARDPSKMIIPLTVLTLIYMALLYKVGYGGWWISSAPSFPLGFIMAIYRDKLLTILRRYRVLALILAIALVASAILADHARHIFQPLLTTAVSLSTFICLSCYRFPRSKVLSSLGDISYEIYIMQGMMFTIHWHDDLYLRLLVIPISAILGAWLLHKIFLRVPQTLQQNP